MININDVQYPATTELLDLLTSEIGDLSSTVANSSPCERSSSYSSARQFALDYQVHSLLKKLPTDPSQRVELESEALRKFLKSEAHNEEVNKTFSDRIAPFASLFEIAKKKIANVLGSLPNRALDFQHGPGTSLGMRGGDTSLYSKCRTTPTINPEGLAFAKTYFSGTLYETYHLRDESVDSIYKIVDYAKLTFVPKTKKSVRSICIEPLLSTYFQKGIGSYIRDRLQKKAQINLKDQTRNQRMASEAGQRNLCTVDFENASNTIAYQTVANLLPVDWLHVLSTFRSRYYCVGAETKPTGLQMFSSMGNGYTFELESLLFYAAAFAVVSEGSCKFNDISVYGDDVIIPREDYLRFEEFTSALGFSINKEKTFIEGNFFESCGMDYFQGVNVRPIFLKNNLRLQTEIISLRNRLLAFSERWFCPIPNTLGYLESFIEKKNRNYGFAPYEGLLWYDSISQDSGITSRGWEGSTRRFLSFVPFKRANDYYEPAIMHSFRSPSEGTRTLRENGAYRLRSRFLPRVSS